MAPHSSVLAWRIPGMGEPGGLPSMGSHKVRTQLKRLSSSSKACLGRGAQLGLLEVDTVCKQTEGDKPKEPKRFEPCLVLREELMR